jgi:hypothetical protein
MTLSKEAFAASVETLRHEASGVCRGLIDHIGKDLGISLVRVLRHLPSFFLPHSSLPAALTIFDSFCNEGRKVLIRVYCALLSMNQKTLIKCADQRSFFEELKNCIRQMREPDRLGRILKQGFKFHMTRKHGVEATLAMGTDALDELEEEIEQIVAETRSRLTEDFYEPLRGGSTMDSTSQVLREAAGVPMGAMTMFQPRLGDAQIINTVAPGAKVELTLDLLKELSQSFPPQIRSYSAKLVYHIPERGTAWTTFIEACSSVGYYLLVIRIQKGVIGALISDALDPRHRQFFGRASTFVWQVDPVEGVQAFRCPDYSEVPESMRPEGWKEYISLRARELYIGGHQSALYLRDGFHRVLSRPCSTFFSPSLTEDSDIGDEIKSLEIYHLVARNVKAI